MSESSSMPPVEWKSLIVSVERKKRWGQTAKEAHAELIEEGVRRRDADLAIRQVYGDVLLRAEQKRRERSTKAFRENQRPDTGCLSGCGCLADLLWFLPFWVGLLLWYF